METFLFGEAWRIWKVWVVDGVKEDAFLWLKNRSTYSGLDRETWCYFNVRDIMM
ncbi:hypothetical protein HanIR_Chr02g0098831 [Helianthus annuus]|nr:hypothetical protein HanIR_Chr02g0098831 [Helianthus annuus]